MKIIAERNSGRRSQGAKGSSLKKFFLLGLILLVGMTFLAGCGGDKKADANKVLVTIGDKEITQDLLDKRFALISSNYNFDPANKEHMAYQEELKKQILDSLIDEAVLLEEAIKRGYEVPASLVESEIEFFKGKFASEADYEDYLANYIKITKEDFKELIANDLTISQLFDEITSVVTENSMTAREYYEANKDQFVGQEEVLATHILVDTEEEAKKLIEEIKNGADMQELAYEHSTDPSVQTNFGNLGWFGRGVMVPEFEEAVFSLEPGQLYPEPVKSQFGYHVIYLKDKEAAGLQSFADLEAEIEDMLLELAKNDYFVEFIDSLRSQADIKIN